MTIKILFVDDEAMALKYFERLVSPLAPVLTATSVADGRALLDAHSAEIGVLVTDQRMPGAYGNELLRHARERHPHVVRMLTTAYSELGEAIDAINSGEIYRYITKPWDLARLQADLRNALELAALRGERDRLLREKLLVQQLQLLGHRAGQLAVLCGPHAAAERVASAMDLFLHTAAQVGGAPATIDWGAMGYPELVQAEAERGTAITAQLAQACGRFATVAPGQALPALAAALGMAVPAAGQALALDPDVFTALLCGPVGQPPAAPSTSWLGWLLTFGPIVQVTREAQGWAVRPVQAPQHAAPAADWLAAAVERLLQSAQAG
jgi:two-component system probable response regulator PhcQ